MFKEGSLTLQNASTIEKEKLSPEELQLQIKQELDQAVKEYTAKNPSELTGKDYASALYKIETLEIMAKKFSNDKLMAYIGAKLTELKNYKDSSSRSKFSDMDSWKKIPDPKKPQIGTHR